MTAVTVGRIVHLRVGDEWWAAIVTRVDVKSFRVRAFSPETPNTDQYQSLLLSEAGDTWRWPPREGT